MAYIILSDDLSGAAGMASLIGPDIPVIPFNQIQGIPENEYNILSVDLETRNSSTVTDKISTVKKQFPRHIIMVRIDTLLRGSTRQFIEYICMYNFIALTDTIPDYGRYTSDSCTIFKDSIQDLSNYVTANARNKTFIFDSKTYGDLKNIVKQCVVKNLLPVDPGPLISLYLEMVG